jgi:hypothetical protein
MTQITSWLLVVVAALGGFYGGFRYEKAHVPSTTNTAAQTSTTGSSRTASQGTGTTAGGLGGAGGGFQGGAGGGGFGRGAAGKVSDFSGDTLTLTDNQGNPVKVQLSSSTVIEKTAAATTADLVKGATVTVQGQRGSDGTVSATTIVITAAATR